MVAYVVCLTAGGGLPLFVRKKGDGDPLPFSFIASLNGVHLYGKSQNVYIHSTSTQDTAFCWREFNEKIVLIGIACGVHPDLIYQFLGSVFHAMILTVGIDEINTSSNPERLKRELRVSYPVIDKLLDCLESGDKIAQARNQVKPVRSSNVTANSGDITGLVESILCQENQLILNCLEHYTEVIESLYGCVLIHGRLAVATPSWLELEAEEKKLLNILITTSTATSTSTDIPVFLPHRSPNVPFRLVTLCLVNGVNITTLCGPEPSLSEIENHGLQLWRPMIDVLRAAEQTYPRNFPSNIVLENCVLGFLLINLTVGKFVLSRNLNKKESCSLSGSHRCDVLRTFYSEAVSTFLLSDSERHGKYMRRETEEQSDEGCGAGTETYLCSEYHKCHGLRSADNILCVLYAASVPTHTIRIITQHSLKLLTNEKHLCW